MQDNTKLHGPGGMIIILSHRRRHDNYLVTKEADPCFGQGVEGKDTSETMNHGFLPLLNSPVYISNSWHG